MRLITMFLLLTLPLLAADYDTIWATNSKQLEGHRAAYFATATHTHLGLGDLKADGTVPLTADWDMGSFSIRALTLQSDVTTGTAPFTVASETRVTHLNADLLDDLDSAAFALSGHTHSGVYQPADADLTTWAGVTPSANGQSLVAAADYAAMRTLLDVPTAGHTHTIARTVTFTLDGSGSEIADNTAGWWVLPWAFTATRWTLLADVSGAIKIDVWVDTYANYPPDNGDTVTGGHEPEIAASGVKAQDTDISDWGDVTWASGSVVKVSVDSCTTITHAVLVIEGTSTE